MGLPYNPPNVMGANNNSMPGGESTLDVEYASSIGLGIPFTVYSVSGTGPAKGPTPDSCAYILEWAMLISNLTKPALVTSISYGDTEMHFQEKFGSFAYIDRMEIELAKMAARGLTVLGGSGDAGVSNVGEEGNDIGPTNPTCTPFSAFYPAASAFYTSVSSTFLTTQYLPICARNISGQPIECSQVGERAVSLTDGIYWTTGGGFASHITQQKWQSHAVQHFIKTANESGLLPNPNVAQYNPLGRGYPDISTVGNNLLFVYGKEYSTVAGTSASGPVLAGLIALINEELLNCNLPPLGFLNPFLYWAKANYPAALRDVLVGSNFDGDIQPADSHYPEFCPYGFTTQPGWNAVTGLGTPNWTVLRDLAVKHMQEAVKRRANL
jgi:tripeptidyl-peptidase-1